MIRLLLAAAVIGATAFLPPAATSGAASSTPIVFAANESPTLSGDIVRVRPGSKPVNLTHDPAADLWPSVSPNGTKVAFMSARDGAMAFYTMNTDGTAVRKISPDLGPYVPANIFLFGGAEWSPDGRTLAVGLLSGLVGHVYLVGSTGTGWHQVSSAQELAGLSFSWSPNGRWFAYENGRAHQNDVTVVARNLEKRWTVRGNAAVWSAGARLAVQTNNATTTVYSAAGKRLNSFRDTWNAWSPDGRQLASINKSGVLSIRAGGTGPPATVAGFDTGLQEANDDALEWIRGSVIGVSDESEWSGYDTARHRHVRLPPAFADITSTVAADGHEAAAEFETKSGWSLKVSTFAGRTTTVATGAGCGLFSPWGTIDFLHGTGSLVYVSSCSAPSHLYSVDPDGTNENQLIDSSASLTQPMFSPDGSKLAYVKDAPAGCLSCGDEIWIANADGTGPRDVTKPASTANPSYDDSPSFSPDGGTLLFARSPLPPNTLIPVGADLYTVPAAGGTSKPLGVAGSEPAFGSQRIAYRDAHGDLTEAALDGSGPQVVEAGQTVYGAPAWSADGRLAALVATSSGLSIFISPGQVIALANLQPEFAGGGIAWSPDGTQLAFIADDAEGIPDVFVVNADGTSLTRVTHGIGATNGITWR